MENKHMPSEVFMAALVSTLKEIDAEFLAVKRENESVVELFLSLLDRQIEIGLEDLRKADFEVAPSVEAHVRMIVPTLCASLRKSLTPDEFRKLVTAGGMLNPPA